MQVTDCLHASETQLKKDGKTLVIPIMLTREDCAFQASLCLVQMSRTQLLSKEEQETFLHPKEKGYFETLRFDRRRASYLMGRYCAKKALTHQLKDQKMNHILVSSGVFTQPIVTVPGISGIQVSIAHSEDFGCALAFEESHPVAIDLEVFNSQNTRVIIDQLTSHEKTLLKTKWCGVGGEQYTWIWTAKEALSKVLKTGLTVPMSIYEVIDFWYEGDYLIAHYQHFSQYKVISFFGKSAVISMVLPRKTQMHLSNQVTLELLKDILSFQEELKHDEF